MFYRLRQNDGFYFVCHLFLLLMRNVSFVSRLMTFYGFQGMP